MVHYNILLFFEINFEDNLKISPKEDMANLLFRVAIFSIKVTKCGVFVTL